MSRTTSDTGETGGAGPTTLHFADNGMFSPFSRVDPAAIYYDGKTYVTWQGAPNNLDPYAAAYDHTTQTWCDAVKVGDNHLGNNDHGVPCIIRDNNEYLHVFYSGGESYLQHARSLAPNSVASWEQLANIGSSVEYPMVRTIGSTMYMFLRQQTGGGREIWLFTSTDNGVTWAAPRLVVEATGGDWVYVGKIAMEGTTKLHLAWNTYTGGTRQNAYHAYLNIGTNVMHAINGTNLGASITPAEATTHCLIYNSSGGALYNPKPRIDGAGVPYVTFWYDGCIKFTYWNGSVWTAPATINPKAHGSDFQVISSELIEMYLTEYSDSKHNAVQRWMWDGTTWHLDQTIFTRNVAGVAWLSAPQVVVNADNRLRVVWAEQNEVYTTGCKLFGHGFDGYVTKQV